MRVRYTLLLMLISTFFAPALDCMARDLPRLQTLEKYSRIELPVSESSKFKFEKLKNGEALIQLEDVQAGSLDSLRDLRDERISEIDVLSPKHDHASIHIQFTDRKTDAFAYFQANPPKVIIDIWKDTTKPSIAENKQPKTRAPASVSQPNVKVKSLKKNKKIENSELKNHAVSASGEEARDQFAEEKKMIARAMHEDINPLDMDKNIFEHFTLPLQELVLEHKSGFVKLPPALNVEEHWTFKEPDLSEIDGKAIKFAMRLYKEKRYGLAMKTLEIMQRDYPQSPYYNEAGLLEAFALKKLGESKKNDAFVEKADAKMLEIMDHKQADGSAVPFQNRLRTYFGLKYYKQGKWLDSIDKVENIARTLDKNDEDLPYIQLLLAFSYAKVNQLRRAERIYRYVVDNYPTHVAAKEAYYRIVDILASEKNYNRVIDEAEGALRRYPDYRKVRKESLFHLAEAYFWTKNFKKAEQFFQGYIDLSTANPVGALAYVRLGEIAEIADKDLGKAKEFYAEGKDGYPYTYGFELANARYARIEINSEKDQRYQEETLRHGLEKKTLKGNSYRLVELVHIEYLLRLGEVTEATKMSKLGMVETIDNTYEAYKEKYIRCLVRTLAKYLESGDFKHAVELYENEKTWIEKFGPESQKLASIAYRGIGLYSTANALMTKYLEWKGKSRHLASVDQDKLVNRELALNAFSQGSYERTLELLKNVEEPKLLYMRAMSEYRLAHKKEAYSIADRLLKKLSTMPGVLPDSELEELLEVQMDRTDHDRDYLQMEKEITLVRKMTKEPRERIEFGLGDALWRQKKNQEAIKQYSEALKQYPDSMFNERAKYNMGISYINVGKREDAVKVLTDLQAKSKTVWGESAKQELELLEWEKKYSSVLKTLPPTGLGIVN